MNEMKYFYELFESLPRGGPGDNDSTRKAFSMMKDLPSKPLILDLGCGPGMQTLELARNTDGPIIALDNHQPFLDRLQQNARKEGSDDRITPMNRSMLEMDFGEDTFDVIWSEGALYFMGFANGLRKCHHLLKENGYMAVTEAVYLRTDPPEPVVRFWDAEYPDIGHVESKIDDIGDVGFHLIEHFTLPASSWLNDYYEPMETSISRLKKKYTGNDVALGVFESAGCEIAFFREYSDYFGYEFFIIQK